MLELNKNRDKFCLCCGRPSKTIWYYLNKQKPIKMPNTIGVSRKEWKGHKLYKGKDYFYDTSELKFCGKCGKELDQEEEIRTVSESRGEFWGAPCSETIITGYYCACGYSETF